jgi:AcrR family transcriptional regulator
MDEELETSLPRGVALSWGLAKEPQRGPKRELSLQKIVGAAVAIADQEGLSAVSMSRVAESLGFTAMSLYRYIPSKDDLLLLMQEAVCEIPIPPEKEGEDWRQGLREYVKACVDMFREHPWFGEIPVGGVPLTPGNLRVVDWVLRTLRETALNDYEKMSVVLLLSSYARSVGMLMRDFDRALRAGTRPEEISGLAYSKALKQLVTAEQFPYLYPIVQSGAYTEENREENSVGDDFDFGLERILDGIEAYLNAKRKAGSSMD